MSTKTNPGARMRLVATAAKPGEVAAESVDTSVQDTAEPAGEASVMFPALLYWIACLVGGAIASWLVG